MQSIWPRCYKMLETTVPANFVSFQFFGMARLGRMWPAIARTTVKRQELMQMPRPSVLKMRNFRTQLVHLRSEAS